MSNDTTKLRWGILGPGEIAKSFAAGVAQSDSGVLVAIGSRDPGRPGLAEAFPGTRVHDGYAALLADPEVDAIYIATPHPSHPEWAIRAAEAGKHVLVEKPMALSEADGAAMFHAARKAGTFLGEAFMYRLHPQTAQLLGLIADGTIGEVRMVKSSFGFAMPRVMPEHRLYANDLAGGGILDVGGYPVSMARLIAGAVAGKPFEDPADVRGVAHLGETGVDEWASAVLRFPSGMIAEVSCSISLSQDNMLRIFGTKGMIEVPDFWFAGGDRNGGPGRIEIIHAGGSRRVLSLNEKRQLYMFEADAAAKAIRAGQLEFSPPGMTWADSLGNLRVLDKWRADAGLVYAIETPARSTNTVAGRSLERRGPQIGTRLVPGLERPVSRLAIGVHSISKFGTAANLLDAYYERGGNLFDTAWVYGGGKTERIFGDWQQSRGVARDDYTLIGKGAHSPLHYPDVIGPQLTQSLERLRTGHIDVYFLHRDNLDVPVGEFVDAVDAEIRAGRVRHWGGSNWTRERMDEAISYAAQSGKTPPTALSNNFALADMLVPFWPGVLSASDEAWKAWLAERNMPNFAWSSQARGFFSDRAGPDKRDDHEMVIGWYSEGNFARRDRAIALAKELGRTPNQVALAYVLAQPFAVVPLIGPLTLVELDDSLAALDIALTPDQLRWLETGS